MKALNEAIITKWNATAGLTALVSNLWVTTAPGGGNLPNVILLTTGDSRREKSFRDSSGQSYVEYFYRTFNVKANTESQAATIQDLIDSTFDQKSLTFTDGSLLLSIERMRGSEPVAAPGAWQTGEEVYVCSSSYTIKVNRVQT